MDTLAYAITIRLNLYSLCMTKNPKFKIECSIDIWRLTQYKSGMLCKMRQDLSRPFAIAANAFHCNCNKLSRRTPLSPSRTGAAINGRATTRIPRARKNRIGSDNLHSTRALKYWTECQRDGAFETQLRKELRVTMRTTSRRPVVLLLIQNWCWASCWFQEWSRIGKTIDPIRMLR